MSEDSKTPTTVRELGMQFQGFQSLVNEKFKNLTESLDRLAKALEESNNNKADKKDVDNLKIFIETVNATKADEKELKDLRSDFDKYVEEHATVHQEQDKKISKKPILSTILWALFSSILTAVVLYEIMNAINAINGGK